MKNLDEIVKQAYDERQLEANSVAGLEGPVGDSTLESTDDSGSARSLSIFSRSTRDLGARTREIGILAVARELDRQFQWVMHGARCLERERD